MVALPYLFFLYLFCLGLLALDASLDNQKYLN